MGDDGRIARLVGAYSGSANEGCCDSPDGNAAVSFEAD